jgi:hypothetical protein
MHAENIRDDDNDGREGRNKMYIKSNQHALRQGFQAASLLHSLSLVLLMDVMYTC